MNVKLLRQVRQDILKKYKRFDMHDFIGTLYKDNDNPEEGVCGTTMCIAGDALLRKRGAIKVTKRFDYGISWFDAILAGEYARLGWHLAGCKVLGLSKEEGERLFYTSDWPESFRSQYEQAYNERDFKTAAQVASKRITHFIRTKGAE